MNINTDVKIQIMSTQVILPFRGSKIVCQTAIYDLFCQIGSLLSDTTSKDHILLLAMSYRSSCVMFWCGGMVYGIYSL